MSAKKPSRFALTEDRKKQLVRELMQANPSWIPREIRAAIIRTHHLHVNPQVIRNVSLELANAARATAPDASLASEQQVPEKPPSDETSRKIQLVAELIRLNPSMTSSAIRDSLREHVSKNIIADARREVPYVHASLPNASMPHGTTSQEAEHQIPVLEAPIPLKKAGRPPGAEKARKRQLVIDLLQQDPSLTYSDILEKLPEPVAQSIIADARLEIPYKPAAPSVIPMKMGRQPGSIMVAKPCPVCGTQNLAMSRSYLCKKHQSKTNLVKFKGKSPASAPVRPITSSDMVATLDSICQEFEAVLRALRPKGLESSIRRVDPDGSVQWEHSIQTTTTHSAVFKR